MRNLTFREASRAAARGAALGYVVGMLIWATTPKPKPYVPYVPSPEHEARLREANAQYLARAAEQKRWAGAVETHLEKLATEGVTVTHEVRG